MEFDDNYWTRAFPLKGITDPQACAERRIRMWLHLYPQLVASCRLGCKLDASAGDGGGSSGVISSAGWAEFVCIKADIDMAMMTLPPRSRIVMMLCYHEGLLQREIGELIGCHRSTISRMISSSCTLMAAQLHIVCEDGHESEV